MKEKNVRDINRKISYTLSFLGGGGNAEKESDKSWAKQPDKIDERKNKPKTE